MPFQQLTAEQASKLEEFEMLAGMVLVRVPYRDDHYYRVLTKPTAGFVHYIEILEDGTRWTQKGKITTLQEAMSKAFEKADGIDVTEIFYSPQVPTTFIKLFDFDLGRTDGSQEEHQRRLFIQGLNRLIDSPTSFDPFDL